MTTRGKTPTRVIVLVDSALFAEALGVALSRDDELEYLGSATTTDEAIDVIVRHGADVVVIDADMPLPGNDHPDGVEEIKRIKEARREIAVLVLAGVMDIDHMARAAAEGACGFLAKSASLADISRAIRTTKDGGMFVERELIAPLVERVASRHASIGGGSARVTMTPREQEVLTLLGEGLDVTEIAKRLKMSVNTCRGHVRKLLTKLGSHSQLEAVVEAVHQGLLPHLSR